MGRWFRWGWLVPFVGRSGPRPRARPADTLKEIKAPKVSIVYAIIGSPIGLLVVKYGLGVGFVLFGIGGLIRFRSVLGSALLTGQVTSATLIGLTLLSPLCALSG